jgi:hypothetical protein
MGGKLCGQTLNSKNSSSGGDALSTSSGVEIPLSNGTDLLMKEYLYHVLLSALVLNLHRYTTCMYHFERHYSTVPNLRILVGRRA